MNILLQNRSIPIEPQAMALSKTARALALLALLAVIAIAVNAAVILADSKLCSSLPVSPVAFVTIDNGGQPEWLPATGLRIP